MNIIRHIKKIFVSTFLPLSVQAKIAGVKIGKRNFIESRFWSTEAYLISIGNDCAITSGVRVFTHGGGRVLRDSIPDFDTFGKVKIGNRVYIGTCSLIMPGVTIEDNVLIAAGSVVTKSIPANSVVGGNPAKLLCTVDEYKERNIKFNFHTKGLSYEEKRKILLAAEDVNFITKDFLRK